MIQNSFYTENELKKLGLKSFGKKVLISNKTSFYGVENIEIGDNVRIDDFCILSGKIKLGNNIHISAFCSLYGKYGIEMEDYTGLSPRTTVFSAMDDFSGDYLIGPIYNSSLTNVTGGKVLFKKYSQMGANSIVFPNLIIGEGAVTGAMSLVNKDLDEWTINVGIPTRILRNRNRTLLNKIE